MTRGRRHDHLPICLVHSPDRHLLPRVLGATARPASAVIVAGPAVLVPAALAGHLAAALADHVARTRVAEPDLSRLLDELRALELVADDLADHVADGHEACTSTDGWLTISEAVSVYGRPARTLRYQAAAGLVPAFKENHRWLIALSSPDPPARPRTSSMTA